MPTETITPPTSTPAQGAPRTRGLDEQTWKRLLGRIKEDKCTPVIGSGACTAPPIAADVQAWNALGYPKREDIARDFARDYNYPLEDQTQLERVAKYVAATSDVMTPKEGYA